MKKLLLIFLLMPLLAMTQVTISPVHRYAVYAFPLSSMSGTDTLLPFKFFNNETGSVPTSWSAQAKWLDVDTTGYIGLEVTNFEMQDWEIYYDSLHFDIVDTTGHDSFEDDMFNWRYGAFRIQMDDTCTGGKIWIIINAVYSNQ